MAPSSPRRGTRALRSSTRDRGQRGMITVELAIGLLVVALAMAVAAFTVSLIAVQTRCGDTAAAVARQLARGDATGAAGARATAPRGARVQVASTSSTVTVTVSVDESLGRLGPFHLAARSEAVLEPGVQP